MKYNVGDEVLLKAKIVGIDEDLSESFPIKVEFDDESTDWYSESSLIPAECDYDQGMTDAWELARTLYDNKCDELGKIFGIWDSFYEIIRNCTPQEALAKLKAYEEAQKKVEVGDILRIYGEEAVVTRVEKEYVYILFADGFSRSEKVEEVVGYKTGKHIELASILEQIGE